MAASITIGSLALAADGKTLTGTLAGGTGSGYTPASAVTGLIAKLSGTLQYVAFTSCVISGTTLTMVLQAVRTSADTLTLDAILGGNLTDSGSNTLQTVTGMSVTNGSTVSGTFATILSTDAAAITGGVMVASGAIAGEADGLRFSMINSEIRTRFTGVQLELRVYSYNGLDQLKVSIDGGAYVTKTMPKNQVGSSSLSDPTGWQWMLLADGLSDAVHTVSVYAPSTINFSAISVTTSTLKILGTAPAFSREAAYQGIVYRLDGGSLPAGFIANAQTSQSTAVGGGLVGYFSFSWPNSAVRFRAKISELKIWGFALGQNWLLTVDGVPGAVRHLNSSNTPVTITPTGSGWGWDSISMLSGLDDTAFHVYELEAVSQFAPDVAGQYWIKLLFVHDAVANGSGGLDTAYTPVPFPAVTVVSFGDSRTQMTISEGVTDGNFSVVDTRISFIRVLANALGLQAMNRGLSGTTQHNFGGSAVASHRTNSGEARVNNHITTSSGTAQKAFIDLYGVNDLYTLPDLGSAPAGASGALTTTNFRQSVEAVWTSVLTAFPTKKVLIVGIAEISNANNSGNATYGIASTSNINRLALNTARADAVTNLRTAFPAADIRYVSLDGKLIIVSGLFPSASTDSFDGLHENALGNAKIANILIPHVNDTGFAITGPATGATGVASTAFTLTLPGGATFTGTETVTLTASDGTITATAAGGSISGNGTGAVTVTPAAAATAFTFTYTPASAGAKTITPTNGQGWTNPAAAAFTATVSATSNMFFV